MISFLTLNIGAASRTRAEELLSWLARRDDDAILLTETSAGDGTAFLYERFRRAGYQVIATANENGDRGAALVTKIPVLRELTSEFGGVTIPGRVAGALLDCDHPLAVVSVYVPSRDLTAEKLEKKEQFLGTFLRDLGALTTSGIGSTVVGGDYNVIAKSHVPRYPGYRAFEFDFLDGLEGMGLFDAQQVVEPGVQVHSWVGRTGDGYKYDYFHVGSNLTAKVASCQYLAETRQLGLTDHSAVALVVDGIDATRLAVEPPRASDVMTLFDF